jgi:hypothetical protein
MTWMETYKMEVKANSSFENGKWQSKNKLKKILCSYKMFVAQTTISVQINKDDPRGGGGALSHI